MSFRFARLALPLIAMVAIAATACVPVKQVGKNILATTISNGCLPGLPSSPPMNGFRSPSQNFSREVCSGGAAGHSVGQNGVTLQVVNSSSASSGASFVIGSLYQLGDINSIKVATEGGSAAISVALVLDKSGDAPNFLCPAGPNGEPGAGFCGDAIASFGPVLGGGGERVILNDDLFNVFYDPCNFVNPAVACLHSGPTGLGSGTSLAALKQGFHAGIDGFTKTVVSVSMSGTDAKAVVKGVEINGQQLLP